MISRPGKLLAGACVLIGFASTAFGAGLSHLEEVQQRIEAIRQAIQDEGGHWSAGLTAIARLTDEEKLVLLGARRHPGALRKAALRGGAPSALDWRNNPSYRIPVFDKPAMSNFVSRVKHQGGCGSCWAFAVTGALESYWLRTGGDPEQADLSEQAVLSCSGAGSCKGGLPTTASDYLRDTGIPLESDMPYMAADAPCPALDEGARNRIQRIGSWRAVPKTVADIKAALNQYGPLPTTMAVYEDFMTYESGVYHHVGLLSGRPLNPIDFWVKRLFRDLFKDLVQFKCYHAILIVGYDDSQQAFIVKNSWGSEDWGEEGFFRIAYSQLKNMVSFGEDTIAYVPPEESPELSILSPDKTQPVSSPVTVSGNVSRPSDLQIKFDGEEFQTMGQGRFEGGWSQNAGNLSEGAHTVTVRARDATGGAIEEALQFQVGAPDEKTGTGER